MVRFSFFLSILLLLVFLPSSLSGATWFVSNAGNNNNAGTSWAQAWLELQYAADEVAAGDTVWVANGTYEGFDLRTTGTSSQPIVFIAAGNDVVINQPCFTTDGINVENADHIEINGMRVINQPRNGIRLVNAHNCIVRNNYCENNFERGIFTGFTDDILIEYNECLTSIDEHGIYVSNSSDRSVIRYNVCHDNNRGGIQINADASQGGDGISTAPQIYGNILYENGAAGGAAINLDGVQEAFIYNNLLYENHATGIALFRQDGAQPSSRAIIVHNTIVNASNGRWCILAVNGSDSAQVYNNIIINQHTFRGSIALDPDAVPGFDSDYNVLVNRLSRMGDGSNVPLSTWQTYGYDENSMLADALSDIFVNPGVDYHLAADAQAINAGNAAFSFGVVTDIEGNSRPQGSEHDLGAYEASGILAIGDEKEDSSSVKTENPGIIVTSQSITWSEALEGDLLLLNSEGKVIHHIFTQTGGEFPLDELIPGIYVLTYSGHHGVQWSRWVIKAR